MAKKRLVRRLNASGIKTESEYGRPGASHGSVHNSPIDPAGALDGIAKWMLLLCATLAAYWPSMQGSLLWDDNAHVTKPALQSLAGLWRIWFELGATQQYYPILHSAFWIEHRIWGDAPLGYHLTNVVLHAVSAGLVVLIVRRLALPGAWLAGFIFALHPVCVEGVAWISEQKSTLSGVFYLASALVYLRFDESRRNTQYFLATGLFILALLCKTVTATLPAALLVVFWWLRGRLLVKQDVLPLLPWFAVGVPAGLFTAWVERTYIGAQGAEFALTLTQRLLLASRVIWFYAIKLVWPAGLLFSYPRWTIDARVWWQYLFVVGLLALVAILCVTARHNRGPMAGFLFFAGTLFPVLGFLNVLPFRYSFVADHFQYLACLGLIVPVAVALSGVAERIRWRGGAAGAVVLLLIVLGGLSWRHNRIFTDDETLYRATLAGNPSSWLAHMNLGSLLLQSERPQEAITELREALRLKPDLAEAHDDLASALAKMPGGLPEAIAEYETALRLKPDYDVAYSNLGNALLQVPGRVPEAIAAFHAALRIKPDSVEAHNNLGNALSQLPERLADAVNEYQIALRLEPGNLEARYNMATALLRIPGRLPEAVAEFQAVIQLKPDFAEAHLNLANAWARTPGRLADALAECERALLLQPDLEPAQRLMTKLRASPK